MGEMNPRRIKNKVIGENTMSRMTEKKIVVLTKEINYYVLKRMDTILLSLYHLSNPLDNARIQCQQCVILMRGQLKQLEPLELLIADLHKALELAEKAHGCCCWACIKKANPDAMIWPFITEI